MKALDLTNPIIIMAIGFAKSKHAGIKDDTGADYFEAHLMPVALALAQFTDDAEVLAAALLHDTLEDTDTSWRELLDVFGKRVAYLVILAFMREFVHQVGYYFPRLVSREAVLIKFLDRASNLSRMQTWDEKRRAQYLKRSKFWKGREVLATDRDR
jgi:(p)ppGpp synthase/HD superfamily hydrolase